MIALPRLPRGINQWKHADFPLRPLSFMFKPNHPEIIRPGRSDGDAGLTQFRAMLFASHEDLQSHSLLATGELDFGHAFAIPRLQRPDPRRNLAFDRFVRIVTVGIGGLKWRFDN